ncbi:hypothetical protein [Serratia ficaria]|uniref:hypothetical protein n=1 Tax=Serratia ficaria TaxID=61651 RepID=UPI000A6C81BB|nr:hypothetical protein [Serratia ficaria]
MRLAFFISGRRRIFAHDKNPRRPGFIVEEGVKILPFADKKRPATASAHARQFAQPSPPPAKNKRFYHRCGKSQAKKTAALNRRKPFYRGQNIALISVFPGAVKALVSA